MTIIAAVCIVSQCLFFSSYIVVVVVVVRLRNGQGNVLQRVRCVWTTEIFFCKIIKKKQITNDDDRLYCTWLYIIRVWFVITKKKKIIISTFAASYINFSTRLCRRIKFRKLERVCGGRRRYLQCVCVTVFRFHTTRRITPRTFLFECRAKTRGHLYRGKTRVKSSNLNSIPIE